MYKKFEISRTKIEGSCQSGRKVVTHDSMSGLPLGEEGGGGHFHCITLPLRMMSLFLKLLYLTLKIHYYILLSMYLCGILA